MQIELLNPNSDLRISAAILRSAKTFLGRRGTCICRTNSGAPPFIETYEDIARSGPGLIRLVRAHAAGADVVVAACHYDPHLDTLKRIARCPVVGIGDASMRIAALLGHRFSIITDTEHAIPIHAELARKYHMRGLLASIRSPGTAGAARSDVDGLTDTARIACDHDGADVIVLGCAGLAGLDRRLSDRLGVPVLDGIPCALMIAEGLARVTSAAGPIRRKRGGTSK